jgi:3-hydroxymyristoyl/3-hydroxydecanoyl-(acyl carrier protein) dehydratase
METRVIRTRLNIGWVEAEARVDGKLACSGQFMFSIASESSNATFDATILHL